MNVLAQDIHATFVINCLSSRLSYEAVSRPYLGILNVIMMLVGFRVKIPSLTARRSCLLGVHELSGVVAHKLSG